METDEHVIPLYEDEYLRGSRFDGPAEPEFPASSAAVDEPSDFPVGVTPIVIDSLPGSPQKGVGDEGAALEGLFERPPEDFASADGSQDGGRRDRRNEKLPIYVLRDSEDSPVAVNLGRDADVVFSEADLLVLRGIEAVSSKAQTSRVSKRGISAENFNLGESSSKRSKSTSCKLPNEDATSQPTEPWREQAMNFYSMMSKSVRNPSSTMGEGNTGSAKKMGNTGSAENFNLGESSSKRSKSTSCKLPNEDATSQPTEPWREEAMNFYSMMSKSVRNPSSTMGEGNTGSAKKMEVEVGRSPGEESEAKRRLEFSAEAVELGREVVKISAGQTEKMKKVEDLTCKVNNLSVEGNSVRGKTKDVEMDNAADGRSIRGEKRALHKRVLPSTVAETWTFAGEGGAGRSSRNAADASRREAGKFTEVVTDTGVGEAVPVTENVTEAARGEVVISTRDTAHAGRGESPKTAGCSTDDGLGEAAATAENVVEAGDVGGRGVWKNNRNPKYVMLDMIKAVMRITESERWRSQRAWA